MWVEKYRPTKLSEIVDQKEIIGSLTSLLKNQDEMPHLLFSGSAGIGKTTAAVCISRQILGEHWKDYTLELNASDERGINMVRDRVKKFSRFAGLDSQIPFKIIILDEADEMTSDAQTALRRIIEDTAKYCRFILIANNISKIIAPIQSRCAVFKFTSIPEKDVIDHLKVIAKKEKLKADEKGLKAICDYAEGDMRHSINLLQAAASLGDITEEHVKGAAGLSKTKDVSDILKLALDGKISEARDKMVELVKVYGMSESDFLKYINAAVFKTKNDNLGEILEVIAKYDYRLLMGSNPEIQLSALLAELSKFGKK
ncbi:MAG: replication factor C small subunit [Crenarchaeota archaeon]|nr:MAG: replication factor C small subunit [Thermoproteota archaeon]RDJ33202.1 MAG: replication factor C small subunit [Thermoproteota archaeon]RDJ36295.1 MAG: replication factor C small subunit [Thermoproteota archaeon]RDJ38924.1 MAG: replication factor C small subunit [Thermoproteota archaeon]